jgi:2-amino-4-ketopentanoate thiolase alpha subunit
VKRDRGQAGDWVEIRVLLLAAGARAPSLPEDTAGVPLEARVRGFLDRDTEVEAPAVVTTVLGRRIEGTLTEVLPAAAHSFGRPVPELLPIGNELRASLRHAEARRA